ncbi:hypothetical protein [Aeromonas jandaei]|uniref:hypothetical protein n=1 Tax=Aeromonas jandaei TaxID=650 RepID=UPI001ADDD6D4|nr:hypothetical protein [Aeromonas jandaei]
MARRPDHNQLYWAALERQNLEQAFEAFLDSENRVRNPHSAHLFAIQWRRGGNTQLPERDIIIQLAGDLPPFYD